MAYKVYAADGIAAINLRCKQDAGKLGVMADQEMSIHEVRLHLSAASAAENFTVQLDSALGERYDIVLDVEAMNTLSDYVWLPTRPVYVRAGDEVMITKTNAAGLTWSVTVIYE